MLQRVRAVPSALSIASAAKTERENTMVVLAIAMGAVVWAVIGYALLSPSPPAPDGADVGAHI